MGSRGKFGRKDRSIRSGETLDIEAVHAWLQGLRPALLQTPVVTQYSGGASNWTYRLRYPDQDWVLRRPPAGTKAKSAHDMGREFRVQQALVTAYPVVPRMVALCQDLAVIGSEFYVMERIPGLIPRKELPPEGNFTPARTRTLCTNVIDKLVELHRVDADAVGLTSLGKGPGYPARQVKGWSDRFEKARTWNVPSFREVRLWLETRTPADVQSCVIHNDWRFDNVVLDADAPTKVIGVLDWELATVGDPLMDLGSALAYWVQADDNFLMRRTRRQPTHAPGMLRREEVVAYYLERTGLKTDDWAFYEVFGLFRLAGILQQIYFRYHHGQTRNPAFKNFWVISHALYRRARAAMRAASNS